MNEKNPEVEILLNALSYVREHIEEMNAFTGELGKPPVTPEQYEDAVIAYMNSVIGE